MFKKTLKDQFHYVCNAFADAIALQSYSEELNYSDLKERVSNMSGVLMRYGVKPGDRVVIVMDNSIDYVVAFYAIWELGAIVVSVYSQAKNYEIEKIINQSQARCLLVDKLNEEAKESLKASGVKVIALDEVSVTTMDNHKNESNIDGGRFSADESTLAQIIYTSGTTGNPKGVLLSHGNLMANTRDIVKYLELTEKDSVLNILPFHYSYGNSILHTHLCVGAKVILAGSMAFPQQVINDIRKYRASGFSGVPSTFSLLLTHSDWVSGPPSLRYITQAGGPMSKTLTEQLLNAINSQTKLYIMYGQTEASARISWLPPASLIHKAGSVGIALEHVNVEIRDEKGNKLPANTAGEVYVSGKSIMQGYWNNPAATEKVLNNGWLKTGDLGCLDTDGYIFLKGRNSDMIKVGAHRIHPLELEEIINRLDFVSECAVTGIDDEMLGQKLQAYVVGHESKQNLFALKKHCNEYLPAYKIPGKIKWVDELPKTVSGKIKRYQLSSQLEIMK